jgi:hypothetical protein
MAEKSNNVDRDTVLWWMLKAPPKPFTPKAKKKPTPDKDKAKKGNSYSLT